MDNSKSISEFNQKWQGKKKQFCFMLYEQMAFLKDGITFCCSYTKDPFNTPVMFSENLEEFDFQKYLARLDEVMEQNQTDLPFCEGCTWLKEQVVPEFNSEFTGITVTNFTRCNSKCIYCDVWENSKSYYYNIVPTLEKLGNQGHLSEECLFAWGGGEPLIFKDFNKIYDFILSKGYHQLVNSSGIVFSEKILQGLKKKKIQFQISPDAGLKETYKKIKRQDNFDRVWENIAKYCQYPENVTIKYIIFSLNSSEENINAFIKKCVEANVKNIEISAEVNSVWGCKKDWGHGALSDNEIKAAALLIKLAQENGINYRVSSIWGKLNTDKIKKLANELGEKNV